MLSDKSKSTIDHNDETCEHREEEEQPFIKVTSKRRGRKNCAKPQSLPFLLSVANPQKEPPTDGDIERLYKLTALDICQVTDTNFFRDAVHLVRENFTRGDPVDIVCFGIGRFVDCGIATHQLGFIYSLNRTLNPGPDRPRIQFHEPALSPLEQRVLAKLNCDWHPANVEGKLRIRTDRKTLVFLPHCPKQLTNNFLWANWSADRLTQCALLCNSFQTLHDSTPQRFLHVDAAYIVRLHPYTHELPLRNWLHFEERFNDTALHTFGAVPPGDQLCEPNPVEPCYPAGGSELITAQFDAIQLQ